MGADQQSNDSCSNYPISTYDPWKYAIYVEYVTVGLSLLTIPFYALVIAVLLLNLKRLRYNHAFFIFFLINGVVDILSIFFNAFGNAFPSWGLFLNMYLSSGTIIGTITLVVSYWTRYAQAVNTLLLAFNRSTAVMFPLRYEKIWSRKWTRVCSFLQIFLGTPLGVMVASNSFHWRLACSAPNSWDYLDYVRRDPNGSQVLVIIFSDELFKNIVLGFSFSAEAIVFLVIVVNYSFMIFTVRRQRLLLAKRPATPPSEAANPRAKAVADSRTRQNVMLFRMAVAVCALELCYAAFGVVSITVTLSSSQFHFFYTLVTTVYSSMGPYLLVGFSATTRRLIRSTLLSSRALFDKTPPIQLSNNSSRARTRRS